MVGSGECLPTGGAAATGSPCVDIWTSGDRGARTAGELEMCRCAARPPYAAASRSGARTIDTRQMRSVPSILLPPCAGAALRTARQGLDPLVANVSLSTVAVATTLFRRHGDSRARAQRGHIRGTKPNIENVMCYYININKSCVPVPSASIYGRYRHTKVRNAVRSRYWHLYTW